jgi:DNA-binding CsgD family transcriptional regulator
MLERESRPVEQLTRRECQVAALAAAGLQVKEIAYRLVIAQGTVKLHLHSIYCKLGISSRVKLALNWISNQRQTCLSATSVSFKRPVPVDRTGRHSTAAMVNVHIAASKLGGGLGRDLIAG